MALIRLLKRLLKKRDGRYLIGQGMAGAIYTHWRWPAQARVTLMRDVLGYERPSKLRGQRASSGRGGRGCRDG